jgi:hypothetical protein
MYSWGGYTVERVYIVVLPTGISNVNVLYFVRRKKNEL